MKYNITREGSSIWVERRNTFENIIYQATFLAASILYRHYSPRLLGWGGAAKLVFNKIYKIAVSRNRFMPNIIWKIGVREERKEGKGAESVQKMVTRHKGARKSNKKRVGALLVTRCSMKILRKGCMQRAQRGKVGKSLVRPNPGRIVLLPEVGGGRPSAYPHCGKPS